MATLADALMGTPQPQQQGPVPLMSLAGQNPLTSGAPTWADAADAAGNWLDQQRAISAQRGLWGDQGMTPAGARDAGQQLAMALIGASTAPGIRAFHGSPYSFERFDASKIGTGEGAQAYGHGLYFAENEPVAQQYRDQLRWKGSDWNDVHTIAANAVDKHGDRAAAADALQSALDSTNRFYRGNVPASVAAANETTSQAIALLRGADPITGRPPTPGSMYEVNIASDPQHFLDWDRPLSEQHPVVQQAIESTHGISLSSPDGVTKLDNGRWAVTSGGKVVGQQRGWPTQADANYVLKMAQDDAAQNAKLTGGDIMSSRRSSYTPEGVAKALRDAGIPGIRYLDQGSRGAREPVQLVGGKPYDPNDPTHGAAMALTWTNGDREAAAARLEHLASKPDAQSPDQMRNAAALLRTDQEVPPLTMGQPPRTSNYVVFSPETVEILRKYGLAGLLAGGTGAIAGTQGGQQ